MMNDDYKPKCPKCGNTNFIAISDGYVDKADKAIGMIICKDSKCQTIVGCLPRKEIWDEQ